MPSTSATSEVNSTSGSMCSRKASMSLRFSASQTCFATSTFSCDIRVRGVAQLEDVDRREDDDPHHVDEVPVDARHLDTEVVLRLRPEVSAPGADVGEAEQHESYEDVGAVQAGEAVEDR